LFEPGSMTDSPILVTGAAGFIGFHVARTLLQQGRPVVGLDNFNTYYDVTLKEARAVELARFNSFEMVREDLADRAAVDALFAKYKPKRIVHLAAQAGVRHSLTHPEDYMDANLIGFFHVLQNAKDTGAEHFVYASSSSVYGANLEKPSSVGQSVDHPVSLYAATKKANELIAHSYSHLFGLPTTGLRFFTVYGPWGRPDMALFLFTKAILEGKPIDVFNHGKMARDFTYIDDIVQGVIRTMDKPAEPDPDWDGYNPNPGTSSAPWRVYNIGNNKPTDLMYMISLVEKALGREAEKIFEPMQPGDVATSHANVDALSQAVGFRPDTPIEEGIDRFIAWYKEYYGVA
jgi:UDP-glucuronate 4-epimerase